MITRVLIDERLTVGPAADPDDAGLFAEEAWRRGDAVAAMAAADRVLATGRDPGARAAGVAAAAAAADGALLDAAGRWRGVAASLDDTCGVWARGRAALAAAVAGDLAGAEQDLWRARAYAPDPAPRGLAVLLEGVDALLDALRGGFDAAGRRLAGLAATTVPADSLASERWDELAITVIAAGGDDHGTPLVQSGMTGRPSSRHQLLQAWQQLRSGQLDGARDTLAAASRTPVLRRDAVLGAAVTVGLARRCGNEHTLAVTWQRVAPVVAGADVELFLLDAWGELAVGAQRVAPADCDTIVAAMRAAVRRAGSPWWALAAEHRWALERAIVAADRAAVAAAAADLAGLADRHPGVAAFAAVAESWAEVLAGQVRPVAVTAAVDRLAATGRRWEAAALCRAAVARTDDPAAARNLLESGRALARRDGRGAAAPGRSGGALSGREREVGALILDGLTHREIGARLYISPKTVEQHVSKLRHKLAASNRATLVAGLRAHLDAA
jgi:DNA-binding CsgD family transcriptional regulator